MGDWMGREASSSLGLGCEPCVGFASFFCLVDEACLGPVVTFDADFAVLPFVALVSTFVREGLSVTEGLGEGDVAALMTRTHDPRGSNRIQDCFSADGTACFAFGALGGLFAPPTLQRSVGARLASAAFDSFHFAHPR
jgi:hypothetical protein